MSDPPEHMPPSGAPPPTGTTRRLPRWPVRLQALFRRLPPPGSGPAPEAVRGEIWLLLHSALSGYLQRHAGGSGRIPREDLEDIASEKALDLLRRCERGDWSLEDRAPGEIATYLSRVARNGLLDLQRRVHGRLVPESADGGEPAWDMPRQRNAADRGGDPDARLERREFALALRNCAERLKARDRRIWFFRTFYDMPSKEIAAHPEVLLKVGHVDVLLQRCRQTVRECLARRGFAPGDMPPGVFGELWRAFRGAERADGERDDDEV